MKKKTLIQILLVLAGLGAMAALLLVFWRQSDSSVPTLPYTNPTHGYTVHYPSTLPVNEVTGGAVVFGDAIEARAITVAGQGGQTVEEAARAQLLAECDVAPMFTCSRAIPHASFATADGVQGYSFSFEDTPQGRTLGPVYVIPLATGATASKVLVLRPLYVEQPAHAGDTVIKSIAESVVIGSQPVAPRTSIEAYVRANISRLAPEKEQLGGTFFVTDLIAADGLGTVSYEDGHNAYDAEFTYEYSASGEPVITSFVLR